MHFHVPKPLHGWREFFGEVGVIVLGVLIALSAEQLAEAIHWRLTINAERKALDRDIQNMWSAMSARAAIEGCVDRRLNDLRLVFDRHQRGLPLGIFGPVGRPGVWTATTNAFQMATADQSLSHMSMDEKSAYFDVYETYQTFVPNANEERASWRKLEALNEPTALDAADWRDLRNAYRDALDSNRLLKFNLVFGTSGQWLAPFARFPRMPQNKDALRIPMVQDLCRPAIKQ